MQPGFILRYGMCILVTEIMLYAIFSVQQKPIEIKLPLYVHQTLQFIVLFFLTSRTIILCPQLSFIFKFLCGMTCILLSSSLLKPFKDSCTYKVNVLQMKKQ